MHYDIRTYIIVELFTVQTATDAQVVKLLI